MARVASLMLVNSSRPHEDAIDSPELNSVNRRARLQPRTSFYRSANPRERRPNVRRREGMTETIAAVVGALVGALAMWAVSHFTRKGRLRDEAKLQTALELLGLLARAVNREATQHELANVDNLRHEWAQAHRKLYLLGVPDRQREQIDQAMTTYLDGLVELQSEPDRRPEVERRRELAKRRAYELMQSLGIST